MNTTDENPFNDLFAGLEHDEEYLAIDFAEQFDREIQRSMKAQGVSRKALAERMEVTPSRVTKLLSGEENLTVLTMVKVALALGLKVEPKLTKLGAADSSVPEVKTKEFKSSLPVFEVTIDVWKSLLGKIPTPAAPRVTANPVYTEDTVANIIAFSQAA
jgi:HTH-type transcriptional regulator/antitoxin HipB